ncbi:T9SS type B sorting domain-containing protein [Aestuariibaculum lutulentum]|uniref:T9SS type B sorting domain-containing protein n=1 Tax=Aestuariibaculum lutulentum TaxID=2920935 RepID=A0ABS9RF50_9FLAO|nr:T9SS type B sorting domain-containing protein [Aestuariibaculum lutulentum]MCH4551574.1 T9SS type B sorting domain-containing protein [Aestuariibaculum lutulentum]
MKKILSVVICFVTINLLAQEITLTHNVGNVPIDTGMFSCEDRDEGWSKIFKLSDFGIAANEQFLIKSLQVALSESNTGATLQVSVYSIDDSFPVFFQSLYPRTVLGTRSIGIAPEIKGSPEIIQKDFDEPIVVPAGTERILVTVHKNVDFYNPESARVVIAGTQEDSGESWYHGCDENYGLTKVSELNNPVPNANFYINVTGVTFNNKGIGGTTTLNHNTCDFIEYKRVFSCSWGGMSWSRDFYLKDFGISTNEEYSINTGQVALSSAGWGTVLEFRIFKIDDNFPESFSEADLIGKSQTIDIPYFSGISPRLFNVEFETSIVVPKDVERVLVEVIQLPSYSSGAAFIAGSIGDRGVSWIKSYSGGCVPFMEFKDAEAELGYEEANFYINVTGSVNHVTNNFEMNISNICSEFLKEFSVEKKEEIASVAWDFGDPNSGLDNTSTDLSPFHDFSEDGTYTITVTVTGNNGNVEVLKETIDVKEPPTAYGIDNIFGCEDEGNPGFSSDFDVSNIESYILGGQVDKVITYIDGSGNKYSTLPNPFTNTVKDRETILVRVSHKDNPCCYSETSFDFIVNTLPDLSVIDDLTVCDDDYDGFTDFNLKKLKEDIIGSEFNIQVEFYHQNGMPIESDLEFVKNTVINQEEITFKVLNTDTKCSSEATFKLIVNPLPIANALNELIGCDDNGDGISEYFDTAQVEEEAIGNQTGFEVQYFDADGKQLPSPLPNPYTNTVFFQEVLTVRVLNTTTECYADMPLLLRTSNKPQINTPSDIYACDEEGGFGYFDLSDLKNTVIGNQSNLNVFYFDENGNDITMTISSNYRNIKPWSQNITVRVENAINNLCFSETNFNLFVNELPKVDLEESYFLCNLEPFLELYVKEVFDNYVWKYQDGTTISSSNVVKLEKAGNYTLIIGENTNGIYCENSYSFELVRSVLPKIERVDFAELSDRNYIEIIASGDGDFEYSIDGLNYQNSNLFSNVQGGIYSVTVKDKLGCGEDFSSVTIVDYPKYFTPNNDGFNDFWQIKGIPNYPNAKIFIYDRYGKFIKQFGASSNGWDGTFNGKKMMATDYWFIVKLDEENEFKGHFSLRI